MTNRDEVAATRDRKTVIAQIITNNIGYRMMVFQANSRAYDSNLKELADALAVEIDRYLTPSDRTATP